MDKVVLGKTDIEVTKIGFGVLTVGATQLNLPINEGSSLLRYALERGINFLDTAEYYNTYPYIKEALKCTNYDPVISSKSLCHSYIDMEKAVEDARFTLDRDVIDIFLLHEVRSIYDYNQRQGALEALYDLKAKGRLRAIGLSTHHVDVAEFSVNEKELDVVFPLINYAGLGIRRESEIGTREDMEKAIKALNSAGKGVYIMKALGGGNLTANYVKALDYVFSLDGIHSVMMGFGKQKEIDDIFDYINHKIDKDYVPDISNKKIHIDQGDCEGCGKCLNRCPNSAIFRNINGLCDIDYSKCLTCGYCAPICPVRAIIMIDK